jgi:DNA recombination protein RmuC
MEPTLVFVIIVLVITAVQLFFIVLLMTKSKQDSRELVAQKLAAYESRLDKNESAMREEFGRNREETNKSAKDSREELSASLKSFEEKFSGNITGFTKLIDNKIEAIMSLLDRSSKSGREELTGSLKSFEEKFSARIETLTANTNQVFEKNRETVEKKLSEIQENNSAKLEEMRKTVDEKLHTTLEKRLTESFKLVSDNLDKVQKGLVEMQGLATGVGDLKNILSNVKTKGVFGEYQLGAILEEMLPPHQYAQNVKTKIGSNDMIEYAVKIPSKEDSEKVIWLPVDAKFPTEDYEKLTGAYDAGNVEQIERSKKDLERTIKQFAKDICSKYIDPPNTTNFAIMFLPFESLYAEVLRIPGLFDSLQRDYKITVTGPTTIAAFLSSLQMGFRSLAVEKRTSEIWELLGAVKTQFGKFAEVLEAAKRKIDAASDELGKTGTRTRAIEKKLKSVESLPEPLAQKLLGDTEIPGGEEADE